jgi:hypothetical protein
LTTQASDVSARCRSEPIDGSATFTIVVSSTIIRVPMHKVARAAHRRRSADDAGRALALVGVVSV